MIERGRQLMVRRNYIFLDSIASLTCVFKPAYEKLQSLCCFMGTYRKKIKTLVLCSGTIKNGRQQIEVWRIAKSNLEFNRIFITLSSQLLHSRASTLPHIKTKPFCYLVICLPNCIIYRGSKLYVMAKITSKNNKIVTA